MCFQGGVGWGRGEGGRGRGGDGERVPSNPPLTKKFIFMGNFG